MSRKLVVTLILILFLLPFVSWYYLNRGLNYRKDAQAIMSGTQPFPQGQWNDAAGKRFESKQIDERVTLITLLPCAKLADYTVLLNQFYDQFKDTKKASFIVLDTCDASASFIDAARSDWYIMSCTDSSNLCDHLLSAWPAGKSHALIDRDQIIRSYYSSNTEEEKRLLLEHMALLIPRERSEKVELKRGQQK